MAPEGKYLYETQKVSVERTNTIIFVAVYNNVTVAILKTVLDFKAFTSFLHEKNHCVRRDASIFTKAIDLFMSFRFQIYNRGVGS